VNRFRLDHYIRLGTALLLVGLEFTNLGPYLAEVQHSRFPLLLARSVQFAAYGLCLMIIVVDRKNAKRLLEKRIILWAFAFLLLLTWAMLVRMFNSPVGWSDYLLFREFGLQVHNIALLLACVVIFDDPYVLWVTKRAVMIATLVGIPLIAYDVLYPGFFLSEIPGRGAGLYMQPNSAGMAVVFGCLIGLTTIPRGWRKELFVLCCLAGVLATFSRQAAISFAVILIAGSLGRAFSPHRLIVVGAVVAALFVAKNLGNTLTDNNIVNSDAWARLTFQWSDSSTKARERLAQKSFEMFAEAPLLGQGFGTTVYWGDTPGHSAYLNLMADCGILGALVIPGLILSIRRRTWNFNTFAGIFLLWGVFSHQVLSELYALITIAILAAEPRNAQAISVGMYAAAEPYREDINISHDNQGISGDLPSPRKELVWHPSGLSRRSL
jgi:O-antigen ligase